MKISIVANEIVDGVIDFISLVKHGANRSPWKIIKMEDQKPSWLDHMPEFLKLKEQLDSSAALRKTETKKVILKNVIKGMNDGPEQTTAAELEANEIRKLEIRKLQQKLAGLNSQQLRLWESPQHPLYKRLDEDYSLAIYKTEAELAVLADDEPTMVGSSAFFFRGGTSNKSSANISDSAYLRPASVRKAEDTIDLSPINTQADFDRLRKAEADEIDLETLVV